MGLHYGIWDYTTKTLAEAIINTNRQLAFLGKVSATDKVLDAGCGVGGSAIFLAKYFGCFAVIEGFEEIAFHKLHQMRALVGLQ